jgi:hypothetical protein
MPAYKLDTGPITLTVARCELVEGSFGPQVCFTDEADVEVYVSEMTGVRQLERLGCDRHTVIGETLHFEKIKKDGKSYVNINRAGGGNASAPSAPRPAAAAPAPKMDVAALALIYAECVDKAMATLGSRCEDAGLPFDGAAIQAAAATLFIRATK